MFRAACRKDRYSRELAQLLASQADADAAARTIL